MSPSSRTPEGFRANCHICGWIGHLERSHPLNDMVCPNCGTLLVVDYSMSDSNFENVIQISLNSKPQWDRVQVLQFALDELLLRGCLPSIHSTDRKSVFHEMISMHPIMPEHNSEGVVMVLLTHPIIHQFCAAIISVEDNVVIPEWHSTLQHEVRNVLLGCLPHDAQNQLLALERMSNLLRTAL